MYTHSMNSGINLGWKNKKENSMWKTQNNPTMSLKECCFSFFFFFFKEAEMFWDYTHVMRQVCIHDEDEVASSVFHPMDVGSA